MSETEQTNAAQVWDEIHDEWRTTPTDLAGWAMRAEAMFQRAKRLDAELAQANAVIKEFS